MAVNTCLNFSFFLNLFYLEYSVPSLSTLQIRPSTFYVFSTYTTGLEPNCYVKRTFLENFEMFEEDVADEGRSTAEEFIATELQ